jgi:hypothetical protein
VDAAAESIEEGRAEVGLELPDVLRERGLAEVKCLGGAPEAMGPSHGQERLELPQGHGSVFHYRFNTNS